MLKNRSYGAAFGEAKRRCPIIRKDPKDTEYKGALDILHYVHLRLELVGAAIEGDVVNADARRGSVCPQSVGLHLAPLHIAVGHELNG